MRGVKGYSNVCRFSADLRMTQAVMEIRKGIITGFYIMVWRR